MLKSWIRKLLWVLLIAASVTDIAWSACSPSIGKLTINEFNMIDDWVEVKLLDPSVTATADWKVQVYSAVGTKDEKNLSAADQVCTQADGSKYYRIEFAHSFMNSTVNVVLLDPAAKDADIFRAGSTTLPVFYTTTCSFTYPTNLLYGSSSSKDFSRLPDGTGDWIVMPGSGSGSASTSCSSNNSVLELTKSVAPVSLSVGGLATFTVTVKSNVSGGDSSVVVNDLLPTGLQYSSHNVNKGSYDPATGVWSVGALASGATATLTLVAQATQAGILTNIASTSSAKFPVGTIPSKSASVTVTGSTIANFDAVEVGKARATNLYTKISGQNFDSDVLALNADLTLNSSYTGTPTVELVTVTGGSCASLPALTGVTVTATGSWTGGRRTYRFNSTLASANTRVRITDGSVVGCSTDNFSIRPVQFSLSAGTALDPVVNKLQAGASFNVTANPGVSAGYTGTPGLDVTKILDHVGVSVGSALAWTSPPVTGFPQATGSSVTNSFQYQDVGTITFMSDAVRDNDFTSVDQSAGDCVIGTSTSLDAQGKYGCSIGSALLGPLGRFYPDHFAVQASFTPGCASGFTYMDQDALGVVLSVTAQSASNVTTLRYVSPASTYVPVATLDIKLQNGASATDFLTRLSQPSVPVRSWTAGMYTASDTYRFDARNASPPVMDGAYDALKFQVAVTDATDGVKISQLNGAAVAPAVSTVDSLTTMMRFGRLWLGNAYGSEKQNLSLPYQVQYWNGQAFVRNTLDSCTALTAANFGIGNYQGSVNSTNLPVAAISLGAYSGGNGSITLAAPNAAGSIDVVAKLGSAINMCPGWAPAYPAGMPFAASYLQGKWCGAAAVKDPSARATFGISGASSKKGLIYLRESY